MNKKVFINFIKDKFIFTAGYFLSTVTLIFYFYLLGVSRDLFYPISLSIFIFTVVIVLEWMRYYKFNINISQGMQNEYYDLQPMTCEQNEISEVLSAVHDRYAEVIGNIRIENSNSKHFLSQWIHNMKTPVSVIELIAQKGVDEEDGVCNVLFKDIQEENAKILNGLEQVLSLLRMEEFFRDYEPEAADLLVTLKEIINSRKSQFIYNNVYPRIECNEEKMMIITDTKWNKVMIEQIVSNAIKYSADTKEKKSIRFILSREKESILLEIKDEGVGIPSYDVSRVFEPFFTGDNGRKYGNSTGIGLYISHHIAEKLGHHIWIESEKNQGTCVFIRYIHKV